MPTRELVSRDVRRLALEGGEVDYVLVRRRGRRGVGLKVDEEGLTVSAPSTMPLSRIEELARESERWILRKIAEWSGRKVAPAQFREGERLQFLGGGLALRLATASRMRVERRDGELFVVTRAAQPEEVRRAVVRWYKRMAHEYLGDRLLALAHAARLAPPALVISSALAR